MPRSGVDERLDESGRHLSIIDEVDPLPLHFIHRHVHRDSLSPQGGQEAASSAATDLLSITTKNSAAPNDPSPKSVK
jgi:hypothetical protein